MRNINGKIVPDPICFNSIDDVDEMNRSVVEAASGCSIKDLDIDDVNDFLTGLMWFHYTGEKMPVNAYDE